MEVAYPKYPDTHCELSPNGAHHYVKAGGYWICAYCGAGLWLPADFSELQRFGKSIEKYGADEAYRRLLKHRPEIREALLTLEKINQQEGDLPIKEEI